MARREEELNGPREPGQEPHQPVDWAKMSERFERDRESRMAQFGEPVRPPEFGQRRADLEPVGEETPTGPGPAGGTEGRDLGSVGSGVLRGRSVVSSTQPGRAPAPTPTPPARSAAPTPASSTDRAEPLLGSGDVEGFRGRWPEIKAVFVDDPRASVQQADSLVEEVAQLIVRRLTEERARLEGEWSRGDVSTEDLRQSLHHYSLFFERLMQS